MKSITEIESETKELSLKFPDTVYYIISKKRNEPRVYTVPFLAMAKINNENWKPVCTYKNGRRN